MEAASHALQHPAASPTRLVEGMQQLAEAAGECFAWLKVDRGGRRRRGRPSGHTAGGGRCSGKAPYDVLADTLRGTKGIMIDRFRQPEKILAAAERFVPL